MSISPVGEEGGGISNALVGTGVLIGLACAFSVPLGIATGIFLSEYRKGRLSYFVRLFTEVLQGIPSIVIGIIAYSWGILGPLRWRGPGHHDATRGDTDNRRDA